MKKYLYTALCMLYSLSLCAQIPANYYSGAQGKSGEALRTALHNCIKNHITLNYDALQDYYAIAEYTRSEGVIRPLFCKLNDFFGDAFRGVGLG